MIKKYQANFVLFDHVLNSRYRPVFSHNTCTFTWQGNKRVLRNASLQRLVLLSMVVAGHSGCNLVEVVGRTVAPLVGRVGYIV